MVWIPGSNNGTWGMGMSRGAVFPSGGGMGGPFGFQGYPLPVNLQLPSGVVDRPYLGRAFGTVYELTPGGVTTENGWGFTNKASRKNFGRKRSKASGKHRCAGIKENGKRCKHKTLENFCKHHQRKKIRRRSKK